MVIADETDEAAMAKWERYRDGVDKEAVAWLVGQASGNTSEDTNTKQLAAEKAAVNLNMGTLVGSHASIARMLDEVASVPDTAGVLLTFDDFEKGIEDFGRRIQPLMACRAHVQSA